MSEDSTKSSRGVDCSRQSQYSPVYHYESDKLDLSIEITDDYPTRQEMANQLYAYACRWLDLAIGRAPIEMQSILQVRGFDRVNSMMYGADCVVTEILARVS